MTLCWPNFVSALSKNFKVCSPVSPGDASISAFEDACENSHDAGSNGNIGPRWNVGRSRFSLTQDDTAVSIVSPSTAKALRVTSPSAACKNLQARLFSRVTFSPVQALKHLLRLQGQDRYLERFAYTRHVLRHIFPLIHSRHSWQVDHGPSALHSALGQS